VLNLSAVSTLFRLPKQIILTRRLEKRTPAAKAESGIWLFRHG
jgi:hypothetical protein